MKAAYSMSRLLLLTAVGTLPLCAATASATTLTEPGKLVITSDGLAKPVDEVDSSQVGLAVTPFSSTDSGRLTIGRSEYICGSGPSGIQRVTGFTSGGWGSYNPTTLTGGK